MVNKNEDTCRQLREMFVDCINKGYEHLGFRGDFVFSFDDTANISDNDMEHYTELCEACSSDEFFDELHRNAVLRGIADIDIYEQCMRNHFNDGNALPFVKAIQIMGRKDKNPENTLREELREFLRQSEEGSEPEQASAMAFSKEPSKIPVGIPEERSVEAFIAKRSKETTFNQAILQLIDASGRKDSDIYKKAWIQKATFSNIRRGGNASKMIALQLCVALELDYEQTQALLAKAGIALGNNKSDFIFEFFIRKGIYDLGAINEALHDNGCRLITK